LPPIYLILKRRWCGYVRVHGETRRFKAYRCTAWIRRLRRRRTVVEAIRRRPYAVVLFDEIEGTRMCSTSCCKFSMMGALPMLRSYGGLQKHHYHYDQHIGSQYILDLAGDDSRYEEMRNRVMEAMRALPSGVPQPLTKSSSSMPYRNRSCGRLLQLQVARLVQRLRIARCHLSSPMLRLTFSRCRF